MCVLSTGTSVASVLEGGLGELGDVLEAVGAEMDPAVPSRDHHKNAVGFENIEQVRDLGAGSVLAVVVIVGMEATVLVRVPVSVHIVRCSCELGTRQQVAESAGDVLFR